jgi:AraC-like DNA-binding protein
MKHKHNILVDPATLSQLFNLLPDNPFFVKDLALRYRAVNTAMVRLCGARSAQDMLDRTSVDFFPARDALRYEAQDRQVISTGRALTIRLDLSRGRFGRPTWLLFTRIPLRDARGRVLGIAATSRQLAWADQKDPVYRRLSQAVELMASRLDQALDLPDLAHCAGISSSQLGRDFKRLFRITAQDYLASLRIERALDLLDTHLTIATIAQECGFSDHSAFTRRFRKHVGMSPTEYRRSLPYRSV